MDRELIEVSEEQLAQVAGGAGSSMDPDGDRGVLVDPNGRV